MAGSSDIYPNPSLSQLKILWLGMIWGFLFLSGHWVEGRSLDYQK
jgi:hypothetical protein